MGPQSADVAHPAFAKLFVETEYLADLGAILATRRKRTPTEPEIWAAHLSVANGEAVGRPEFETDRARFLGRGHGVSAPLAMLDARPLTNSVGTVLDPIFALRRRVRVAPGATVRVAFWTMAAGRRAALLDCIDKHRDAAAYERATTLAWTQAQVQLHHLGVKPSEAGLFQRLASHVIFAGRDLRPSSDVIRQGSGPPSGLWSLGISGELPIVLLRIADIDGLDVARQLLQAHEYWRMKQLAVDLVILNERKSSYVQDLQMAIETLVRTSQSRPAPGIDRRPGRVFVLRADLIAADTRSLLISTARVVLAAQQRQRIGTTRSHRRTERADTPRHKRPGRPRQARPRAPYARARILQRTGRICGGGQGICDDTGPGQSTPAPWINVIANPSFGFQTATEGSGYTWSANSRENQLTPWSNDPISDPQGEAFYVRDDKTGDVWSPTALPIRDASSDLCRPSRPRLQPLRTHCARHRRQPSSVRTPRRIDQDIALAIDQ